MALVVAILLAVFVLEPPWGVAAVGAGAAVELAESALLIRWSRRRRAAVGVEALVGEEAVVVDGVYVRVGGELWRARGLEGRDPGDVVRVRAVDGLELEVG
jgi:membrane protein implicated in regulation of membrane protease activity